MLKSSSLVFCAVLEFAAFAHGAEKSTPRELTPDYIKVEMRGKLRLPPVAKGEEGPAQLVVHGFGGEKRYELDLPADKAIRQLARKLDGATVLITGELVTIYDLVQSGLRPYPPRDVVRVKTLKAVGPEK